MSFNRRNNPPENLQNDFAVTDPSAGKIVPKPKKKDKKKMKAYKRQSKMTPLPGPS